MSQKRKVKTKGKKKRTSNESSKKYEKYSISGDKLERKGRTCPKCGAGVHMAEHKDRYHCGSCGFMEKK